PENTRRAEKGVQNFQYCLLSNMVEAVPINFHIDMTKPTEIREIESLVTITKAVCKKERSLLKCFEDMADAIAPCVDTDVSIETSKKTVKELADYLCDNDAEKTTVFFEEGGMDCIGNHSEQLTQCQNVIRDFYASDKKYTNAEVCKLYEGVTDCIVSEISKCPKQSSSQFISHIFASLKPDQCPNTADNLVELH
ncbi:DUF1397 domain-containing protein, partial [Actinoallomurus acaciae]